MELFKLLGTIAIDNSNANKALDETSQQGQKTESKLSKAFGTMGRGAVAVGKAVGAGMLAAGTAVAGLVGTSVNAYAAFEQLKGGVETLFGAGGKSIEEYAASVGKSVADVQEEYSKLMQAQQDVLDNAKAAYATAGMSANQYMETVTSFAASLLQSLGGDTEKAAAKADMAIRDMSDNANKMGTSMEMIQNAYQGFAKQNYTMLDNLKLGYGGTKEEMQRLLKEAEKLSGIKYDISSYGDIVDAIHVIQTEMGITGTTAAEAAGTISGSAASAKAAWQNLMTAMSDDNADVGAYITTFVNSAAGALENFMPRIEIALQGVVQLVEQLAPILIAKIPDLIGQLLPAIISASVGLVNSVVDILPQLLNTLFTQVLPQLLTGFASIFSTLFTKSAEFIQTNLPVLTDKAQVMMESLGEKIRENLPVVISKGLDILMGLSETLVQNIPTLVATGMDLLKSIVQGIVAALPELIAKAPEIITNFANTISGSMQTIFAKGFEIVWELIKGIIGAIPDLVANIPKIIEAIFAVWNAINWVNLGKNLVNGISTGIKNMGNSLKKTAKDLFTKLQDLITNIFKTIGKAITNPIQTAKTLFTSTISGIKSVATSTFNALKSSVTTIFNGIRDAISNPMQTAKNTIKGVIDSIKGFFNFKISWPKVPLPRFSISPAGWKLGDLLKGSIPKLSISWYKKAMDEPYLFTKPTLFGYNPATGQARGAGEAGDEVMIGKDTMLNMIQQAVAAENDGMASYLKTIIDILKQYFPESLEAMRTPVTFDANSAARALAVPMNRELGKIAAMKGRGR